MHPLIDSLSYLKDVDVEEKIQELSAKYFQTNNPSLKQQIQTILEMYQVEMDVRKQKAWDAQYKKRDRTLDELIKVR